MKAALAFLGSAALLFGGLATASAIPDRDVSVVERRDVKRQTAGCENTATSRDCWGDYNIDTNWYDVFPDTGVTREYWLSVQNVSIAPDGYERYAFTFNGTIPGPTIFADWGDTLVIHVTNNMEENGTSIHWHGIRQLNSTEFDGVPGVTQCPIAPGDSMTYTFKATQYGTTWYHSHLSLQYAEGLYGPLIINGPATADYDEDLGALMVQDWNHESLFKLWPLKGGPPALTNTLLNGTNTFNCTGLDEAACLGTGKYLEVYFVEGTTYRLRIINAATDMKMRFQIDSHDFQVISTDLVPIVPYTTDNILIGIGQRYDIVVNANATNGGNFWIRSVWQTTCSTNLGETNSLAILRYNTSSTANPTTTPATTYASSCLDEPLESLVPWVALNATASTPTSIVISAGTGGDIDINESSLLLNWSDPTILIDYQNGSIFPTDYNVFALPNANEWVSFLITDPAGPGAHHPLHLHGHDFYILGQSADAYVEGTTVLNYVNPPRRDVATLIPGGYLAITFITDNPGSWLAHCHIAWHASEGLAWQYVERESEITGILTSAETFLDTCKTWDSYYTPTVPQEDDSGI